MIGILSRALCFVAIIAVGFLLRRAGFFKRGFYPAQQDRDQYHPAGSDHQ